MIIVEFVPYTSIFITGEKGYWGNSFIIQGKRMALLITDYTYFVDWILDLYSSSAQVSSFGRL